MNKETFFAVLRKKLALSTSSQVQGIEVVIDAAEHLGIETDILGYLLATAWHETNGKMQPVKEAYWVKNAEVWRKNNLRYWPYYGRGLVQLTWESNYRKMSLYFQNELGIDVDFVANPELTMDPKYAAIILIVGCTQGFFTGKRLDTYIDGIKETDVEDKEEFRQARVVVNAHDKDTLIATYALAFDRALRAGGYTPKPAGTGNVKVAVGLEEDAPIRAAEPKKATTASALVTLLTTIITIIAKAFRK